ncbi:DUF6452 family protein [Sinomicrobium kalidii]|uniref:DUF6452 family protein n=1 Tax=Sinomicrobium kalidii TaxID=2900738 RepID=UPI001E3C2280|nr:DUF6452 family protein [Sinomicrobium kalidii]UGU14497.1 DUF6452 family protein [Sinomicrobium kalidii]
MKRLALAFFLIALVAVSFLGCEKDDICPEDSVTTPLLIITFNDNNDPESLEDVPSLRVIGKDKDEPVTTFADSTDIDSIGIPLKVFANESVFAFIRHTEEITDAGDTLTVINADTLTFSYRTEQEFISRACGFITNYAELTVTRDQEDEDNWISSLEVVNPTVENQNTTHVKIYH